MRRQEALEEIIRSIKPYDQVYLEKAKDRTKSLIMPYRALGELHNISEKICAIRSTLKPDIKNKCVFVMAGDHGVVEEGVSAYPQEVTLQMIKAFLNGWATINVIAKKVGAKVVVSDVGTKGDINEIPKDESCFFVNKKVVYGTKNFTKGPAMTSEQAIESVLAGFEIANSFIEEHNLDIVATGDMGIGNTTPSTAIASVITKAEVEDIAGRGTGIDDKTLRKKIEIIKKGISLTNPDPKDPIDILSKVGGAEIGAIAGVVLAASFNRVPVVIDGLISTAGAAIAYLLAPNTKYYMFAGHKSEEPAHKVLLEYIGLSPILQLSMRLGEGTGAALAIPIIETSIEVFKRVKTFEEAGVSEAE